MLLAFTGFSSTTPDPGFNVGGTAPGTGNNYVVAGRENSGGVIGFYSGYYGQHAQPRCSVTTADSDLYFGFAAKSGNGFGNTINLPFIAVSAGRLFTIKLVQTNLNSPWPFTLYVNETAVGTFNPSYGNWSSWSYFEMHISIKNDSSGLVEVRRDGATWFTWTGQTGNPAGSGNDFTIALDTYGGAAGGSEFYVDDWYVLDGSGGSTNTFLGDVKVQRLPITGYGDTHNFALTGGATPTAVLADVSGYGGEVDSTYVSSSTGFAEDMYTVQSLPASTEVLGARVMLRATKDALAAGPAQIGPEFKLNGAKQVFPLQSLTTAWAHVFSPIVTAGLSSDAVNSSQIGMRLDG